MKKRILVVDDEKILHNLVSDLLGERYEIISAFTAQEGLTSALNNRPDLMLVDINMPHMSGCGLSSLLEAREQTRSIPIVFLTGYLDKDEETSLNKTLAGHYLLTKPFNNAELVALVEKILTK